MSNDLNIEKDATTRLNQEITGTEATTIKPPPLVPEFLDFDPNEEPCITIDERKIIHNKFLFTAGGDGDNMFSFDDFIHHDTIIIKSCTGTGKTTAVANHYKRLTDSSTDYRFLSIVDKISLSEEHIKAFKKLNIVSYRETESIDKAKASVICINSLLKLCHITDLQLSTLVVYIDEIDSFLKFTHNTTIKLIKPIYQLLKRIVNKCAKLIVSDATVLNNLYLFLRNRVSANSLMLTNTFKKYTGVKAYHHADEQEFLDCLVANITDKQGFLYGSDSRTVVEKHYEYCKAMAPDSMQADFILITQHNKFKISNATEQFKNKFVFYSPSIVYGVDFNNIDEFQDVFIYICGKSIEPSQSFQQASRTRFIRNLHFYGVEKDQPVRHKTLQAVRNHIKHNVHDMPHIRNLFEMSDENDTVEYKVINFMGYYNLYSYNEYMHYIYHSNKVKHFKLILATHGFDVEEIGDVGKPTKVSKELTRVMDQLTEFRNEDLIEDYIHSENKSQPKFESIHSRATFLTISTSEDLLKYKSIIQNVNEFNDHVKIMRYMRADDYIDEKLNKLMKGDFDITSCRNPYLKIKALKTIEQQFSIDISSGAINNDEGTIELDDCIFKLARARYSQKKPTNRQGLMKFYIAAIKHHVSPTIAEAKQIWKGETRGKFTYQLNTELMLQHLELNSFKNRRLANIKEQYRSTYFDRHGVEDDSDSNDSDSNDSDSDDSDSDCE